jgi:hypothetical protein
VAAEPAVHLRELEPDVAAAHDDEVPRQEVDVHDRAVRPVADRVETPHRGGGRATADVHEDPIGLEEVVADTHRSGRLEARMAAVDGDAGLAQPPLDAVAILGDDRVLARLHAHHVDRNIAGHHSVF